MVIEVGAFEAKTHLSKLLERVRKGEQIVITRHGTPVARLVPPEDPVVADLQGAISELAEIRGHTKGGKESLRKFREEGRKR
jgi:prevent-host-death family protein